MRDRQKEKRVVEDRAGLRVDSCVSISTDLGGGMAWTTVVISGKERLHFWLYRL